MPLSQFLWSNSLFASHFLKNVLLVGMGSTILKNDFEYFRSKISPNGSKMSRFCHYCSLLLLCCSFGSLCSLLAPFKNSLRLDSRAVFASKPLLQKPMICIALAILWMSYAICCFLYAFHALHTPFFHLFVTCLENLLPALVGEHDFQKCMNVKSCQKQLLRPSNRKDYTYFGAVYGTWNLQNRWENVCFLLMDPSLEALFAIM